jgi:hypothetical protein|tara:strand:+ start:1365 stop:1550 length:186 start_codon:yes stop_codon:yes gene_type:complete
MIDYNTMNGLEVLVHLLTSKDGIFLWAIMGFGLAVFLISLLVDRNDDTSKNIKPEDYNAQV